MTQIKYEEVATALAMIQQQFTIPKIMCGIVNYQALQILKIIQNNYTKSSLVAKSFDEWDKIHDNVDFKDLVSHFECDYHPQEGKEYSNPFINLEDRYLEFELLQKNKARLSGYN